ncbi:MAG: deoxyhypusine synthase family protein [Candidatus Thermoplasmatota archaeon]|nr:deoxyhypusine synthase family protein [Candidatus Thermoplasmatota archaeon]
MDIRSFMESHYRHFNAGELTRCTRSLIEFLNEDGQLVLALAGALSTAQIGHSLAPAIRAGKVHAISCTGANLEEDLFLLIAGDDYERVEDWRGQSLEQDHHLFQRGMNRVTDVCIPEEEAIRRVESMMLEVWKEEPRLPHEHLYALLDRIDLGSRAESSWLIAAKEMGIPLLVPGWEDSTLGNLFAAACIRGDMSVDMMRTGIDYMVGFADWYRSQTNPVGFLQVGGGIAGDFPICVVPMLNQDLGAKVPLWSWYGQISESSTSYGGYSGAPPNEKITWGKIGLDTSRFVIESDATIVLPLILTCLLES